MSNQFLSIKQVADTLGLCSASVYKLIDTGELVAVRPTGARAYRIAPEDFDAYVERNRSRSRWVKR